MHSCWLWPLLCAGQVPGRHQASPAARARLDTLARHDSCLKQQLVCVSLTGEASLLHIFRLCCNLAPGLAWSPVDTELIPCNLQHRDTVTVVTTRERVSILLLVCLRHTQIGVHHVLINHCPLS